MYASRNLKLNQEPKKVQKNGDMYKEKRITFITPWNEEEFAEIGASYDAEEDIAGEYESNNDNYWDGDEDLPSEFDSKW